MARWHHWAVGAWALALGILMLGPALLPGYVLSYDMVWVPNLALRTDFLGVGSGLPRAVPSDAVVAVLDELVPGMVLQKLVLVGALVGGGWGAGALAADLPVVARCAVVTVYVWNPFVVERLLIGHWPLLVAYAVLPWLLRSLGSWRGTGAGRAWWLLLPLGSLSASSGVLLAVAAVVWVAGRMPRRRWVELGVVGLAANAPWIVTGLLHAGSATVDARGANVFALSGEGLLPAPLAALALGGIWNAETVPDSRGGAAAVVGLAFVVVMAILGWVRGGSHPDRGRLLTLWAIGMCGAVLSWLAPDALGWLSANVPGAGLMRDGARLVLLCAPAVAVLVGYGVSAVSSWLAARGPRLVVAACLCLVPVSLMPDAALGVSGRLTAVSYPGEYAEARRVVGTEGDVLVLPFSSYRAPAWNEDRPMLDPVGRYLRPNFVVNDELVVDGRPLAGEDPRAAAVGRALRRPEPEAPLAALGIRTVVADNSAAGPTTELTAPAVSVGFLTIHTLPGAARLEPPAGWWVAAAAGWGAYLLLLVIGAVAIARGVRARMRHSGATGWYSSSRSREGTT